MNVDALGVTLLGMFALYVLAQACAYIYKIHSDKFYIIFHFAGGTLTYLFFLGLTKNGLLSLGLVVAVGIIWEIHEWLLWKYFLKKKIYKPGGRDTKNDLIMDFLGALLFYVIDIIKTLEIIR